MPPTLKTILFTAFALCCFAANSVLNRLALKAHTIDANSYVGIRLVSGAVMLWLIHSVVTRRVGLSLRVNPIAAFCLFLYGIAFSYSYQSLSGGTGAFLLFGTVQTTMLTVLLLRGERPHIAEWLGWLLAIGGLAYLVFPGLSAPDPLGAFLMFIAGISWGFYTLRGKGVSNPLLATTQNFILAVPMAVAAHLLSHSTPHFSTEGIVYAVLSGAIASGWGYVAWYAALRGLSTTQAALLQLSVPIIAAFGGVILLAETLTYRLLIAGVLILGGVTVALLWKKK